MPKLTDSMLRKLRPRDKRLIIRDTVVKGLFATVAKRGDVKWSFEYRDPLSHGKSRRRRTMPLSRPYKLGGKVLLGLADARAEASKLLEKVLNGEDPQEKDLRAPRTIEQAIEITLEEDRERKLRTTDDKAQKLALLPSWVLRMPPSEFRRGHAKKLLRELGQKRGNPMGNRMCQNLATVFTTCLDYEWISSQPFHKIKYFPEPKRMVFLNEDELVRIWRACEEMGSRSPVARLVRLLALTGCRLQEIMSATRDEIHGDWLHLAPERVKTGDKTGEHRVYLGTPLAQGILETLPKVGCLFPHQARPTEPMVTPYHAIKKISAAAGVEKKWRPHDLRKTLATLGPRAGIPRATISMMLNHRLPKEEDVAAITEVIYTVPDPEIVGDETQPGWEAWERYIQGLLDGAAGKVLPFREGTGG